MTLSIRKYRRSEDGARVLIDFSPIADCLEPEAVACLWRVRYIDGMLAPNNGDYTLADAEADAEGSLTSPMSWQQLRQWASRFFQIYDCDFEAGEGPCGDLKISCLDSGQWEVSTEIVSVIERIRRRFGDVAEVRL